MLSGKASLVFVVALAIGSIPLASASRPGNRHHLKRATGGDALPKKPDGALFSCAEIKSACSGVTGLLTTIQYEGNMVLSPCNQGEWYPEADLKRKDLDLTTFYVSCPKGDTKCDGYIREHVSDLSQIASDISKAVTEQANCDTTFKCWELKDVDDKCSPTEAARQEKAAAKPEKPKDPLFACQQVASSVEKDPGVTTLTYKKDVKLTMCHEGKWYGFNGPDGYDGNIDYTTYYGSCPDNDSGSEEDSECKKWVMTFKENFDLLGIAISNKLAEKFDSETQFQCSKYEHVDDKCFSKNTRIADYLPVQEKQPEIKKPEEPLFACYEYASTCIEDPGIDKMRYPSNVQLSLCHNGDWSLGVFAGAPGMANPKTWWGSCPSKDDKLCHEFVSKYEDVLQSLGKELSKVIKKESNCETTLLCYKPKEVNDQCFLTADARSKMDPPPPPVGDEARKLSAR
ncbi:uncharacterized protein UTRI_00892_B [Ustilago trichophora]|uniref:Uncharacterized protein n=1 Tax=Ustilago trichophora TaxID=86804 RepID=A0A5C3DQ93_9BASI|nr:uncharacterized protein UTRI_00892_B [Ustilago trichophora]